MWFIEKFKLYIKQSYRIDWSVEKSPESKNPKGYTEKEGEKKNFFYSNFQCVAVKNWDLSKTRSKQIVD